MQTIASRFEYAWDGNLVRGFRVRDKIHRYVAADNGVEVKDGEDTVRIELDPAGHVVKYQRIDSLGLDPTVSRGKARASRSYKRSGPPRSSTIASCRRSS